MPSEILGVGPRRVKQVAVTDRWEHRWEHRKKPPLGVEGAPAGQQPGGLLAPVWRVLPQRGVTPDCRVPTRYHPCCKRLSITPKDTTTAPMYTRTIFASPS